VELLAAAASGGMFSVVRAGTTATWWPLAL
jgi:hypothetical protein